MELPKELEQFPYNDFAASVLNRHISLIRFRLSLDQRRNTERLGAGLLRVLDGTAAFELRTWWEREAKQRFRELLPVTIAAAPTAAQLATNLAAWRRLSDSQLRDLLDELAGAMARRIRQFRRVTKAVLCAHFNLNPAKFQARDLRKRVEENR